MGAGGFANWFEAKGRFIKIASASCSQEVEQVFFDNRLLAQILRVDNN